MRACAGSSASCWKVKERRDANLHQRPDYESLRRSREEGGRLGYFHPVCAAGLMPVVSLLNVVTPSANVNVWLAFPVSLPVIVRPRGKGVEPGARLPLPAASHRLNRCQPPSGPPSTQVLVRPALLGVGGVSSQGVCGSGRAPRGGASVSQWVPCNSPPYQLNMHSGAMLLYYRLIGIIVRSRPEVGVSLARLQ